MTVSNEKTKDSATGSFNSARLRALEDELTRAADVLAAAEENFRHRDRTAATGLARNLRAPDHFDKIREFQAAAADFVAANPAGEALVTRLQRNIYTPSKTN